ncbi:hypothetical protein Scep_000376 [Stephania cephalantha]|uniref:Uncharacterized protein n=1 Tax=Stephania cephalantha TaxID=152367 RepID=A0AAP0L6Y1_9MAGN
MPCSIPSLQKSSLMADHHHHHHHREEDSSGFTADELLVADALIELLYGSDDSTRYRQIPPLSWGRRQRRSVLDNPPHQQTPSPKTPLSFTPSDSDHTTFFNNNNNKRKPSNVYNKIEELKAHEADLSKKRQYLTEAFNEVRTRYEEKERERSALHHFYLSRLQQSMSLQSKTDAQVEPIGAVRREDPQIVESEPSTSNRPATIEAEERNKSPQRSQAQLSVHKSPNALPVISSNKTVCEENRKRRYEINRKKRLMALAKQQEQKAQFRH